MGVRTEFMEDFVRLVFLRTPDASAEKGIRGYKALALMPAMAEWCSSVVVLMLNNTTEPKGREEGRHAEATRGVDNISGYW